MDALRLTAAGEGSLTGHVLPMYALATVAALNRMREWASALSAPSPPFLYFYTFVE